MVYIYFHMWLNTLCCIYYLLFYKIIVPPFCSFFSLCSNFVSVFGHHVSVFDHFSSPCGTGTFVPIYGRLVYIFKSFLLFLVILVFCLFLIIHHVYHLLPDVSFRPFSDCHFLFFVNFCLFVATVVIFCFVIIFSLSIHFYDIMSICGYQVSFFICHNCVSSCVFFLSVVYICVCCIF